ncbi:hypothetical protein DTO280E4_3457 [Paecilomyces variotii]|nr:hypothetical protein DTO280E4_3457 [Paecilomyces variotii]
MLEMAQIRDQEHAAYLAREAVKSIDAGKREVASQYIRQAIAIAPENPEVKSSFLRVREDEENGHPLLDLCRRYTTQKDEDAGKEAGRYLRTDGLKPPENTALECLKLILAEKPGDLSSAQDEIISGLVRQSINVRRFFASELQISVTAFFDAIYDRGDGAAVCLDTIVLDPTLWKTEDSRSHAESELFQLFIAKLMESGHDLDGRSLKGIARLLAVDAERLQHLVDDEELDVIITSLDNRLPLEIRSQATLSVAKYLEASKDVGQKQFSKIISAKVKKGRAEDLIIAFSAAAAVFPVAPNAMASLFLTEGFLQSAVPLVSRQVKSRSVEIAMLELCNAACIDRACREAISKHCSEWLSHTLTNGSSESSDLAAVVLAKIRASEPSDPSKSNGKAQGDDNSVQELVDRFKGLMSEPKVENPQNTVEGLAYSSVKPKVKEQLAKDSSFLKNLFGLIRQNIGDTSVVYGGLMIIFNVTKYLPNMSEEQKKMSQLKAYANASGPSTGPDPLDDEEHVTARCSAVIEAGIVPVLVECTKNNLAQTSISDLVSKILLALSKNPKSRGKLAQQGAVKLLLSILAPKNGNSDPVMNETTQAAAHALARILISVNPSHVFPSSGLPQITSAVRPLVMLLSSPESSADQPRDLLPAFESLLALTNLASSPDPSAAEAIVRHAWSTLEDLLLSNSPYIQRAACELVCNLMTCESGVGKFADGSKRAAQRLHILLALTDVEDVATRKAAGGALAMLTEFDAAVAAVLDRPRGVNLLLGLCQEEDDGLVHRGIACIRNLTCASGDIGVRGREAVRRSGGIDTLKGCLRRTTNPAVLQAGVEALKPLVEQNAG